MSTIAEKMRMVEVIRRNTLQRLRNFWYLVDLLLHVPSDIILEPRIIGIVTEFISLSSQNNWINLQQK